MTAQVTRAMHHTVKDPASWRAPFVLSTCLGDDGTVWSVLTDNTGSVVAKTTPIDVPVPCDAFRTTYRALDRNGQLWCETSDPREVLESTEEPGPGPYSLQQIKTFEASYGWQAWDGTIQ